MTVVLILLFLTACDSGSPPAAPAPRSPAASESPTVASRPDTVSCIGLGVRSNMNYSAKLDRENGLLELRYKARRLRNDGFTIDYRDDLSCRRNPQTRRLIQSAGAGLEIAGCLDLPKTSPEGMVRVELWFGDATERSVFAPSLVVRRDIPATDSIAAASLGAWIEGPTEEEELAGAYPSAPEGTELLGIDIGEGTAVVDLNHAFEDTGLGTTYEGAILEQLAGTMTQFDTVDRALLMIAGAFKDYYMGHGFIVDEEHPLTKPDKNSYRVAREC